MRIIAKYGIIIYIGLVSIMGILMVIFKLPASTLTILFVGYFLLLTMYIGLAQRMKQQEDATTVTIPIKKQH
ncbi:hypothetical protein FZW96_07255 [Bacillus sp. BGMRC 2118]|nr:hypothetical protein FZW96_07255 [Bacillus sp. BGMRC 2118]